MLFLDFGYLNSHNKCNIPKSAQGYTRTRLTDEKKGVKHEEIEIGI